MEARDDITWPLEAALIWCEQLHTRSIVHPAPSTPRTHTRTRPDTPGTSRGRRSTASPSPSPLRPGVRRRRPSSTAPAKPQSPARAAPRDEPCVDAAAISHTYSRATWTILLFAAFARCALMVGPHSGEGKPPMYGDFEAQRHWMEVTVNLPVGEWYMNSTRNDLLYWGLDYPPLTAYGSWAFGQVARWVEPALVAWQTSRGYETPRGKLFMRLSVLLCDVLVWIPAVLLLTTVMLPDTRPAKRVTYAAMLLFLPALLVIDHGHFQYNNVSLGFTVAALAALGHRRWLLSAILYSLALNYKQMALYYSIGFFAVLLAASSTGHVFSKPGQAPWLMLTCGVCAAAAAVLVVFAVLWAPFCIAPAPNSSCKESLFAVLRRQFPFDRSVFEDKVSNLWCVLEPVLKFRSRIYADPSGVWRARVAGVSAVVTLVMSALPAVTLFRAARQRLLGQPGYGHHAWSLLECFCLSLFGIASAFFLASYQVHEKTILLPLLPLACISHRLPLFASWLNILATLSMWPLLQKDGLLLTTCCALMLYGSIAWPSMRVVELHDASILQHVVSAIPCTRRVSTTTLARALMILAVGSVANVLCILGISYVMTPPSTLPDLFPYLSAVACSISFLASTIVSWGMLWQAQGT